jgi:hypothetical protein
MKPIAKRCDDVRIWEATYAAAFVLAFDENTRQGLYFDRAVAGNSERAITIADEAVAQLKQYIDEGNIP